MVQREEFTHSPDSPNASIIIAETPTELWFELVKYLAPQDILNFSHTCQTLHRTLSCKSAWIPILRRVCHERELFLPSFPVETMELSEIQRASLGPYLWEKKINGYHAESELGGGDQFDLLLPVSRHLVGSPTEDRRSFLVPGGRFMVSASSASLSVWDLGIMGRSGANAELVAEVELAKDTDSYAIFELKIRGICVQKLHEDRLRIAVVASGEVLFAKVYEIAPAGPEPNLITLGSLHLHTLWNEVWEFEIDHGRLLMGIGGDHIMLWDYLRNHYVLWRISSFGVAPAISFSILGNQIVHFSTNGITIWPIPTLKLPVPTSGIPSLDDLICCVPAVPRILPFAHVLPQNRWTSFLLPSPWYHNTAMPFIFDAIHGSEPRHETEVYRYTISIDPLDPSGVNVTWLATFTISDQGSTVYMVDNVGSMEIGLLGTSLLRIDRSESVVSGDPRPSFRHILYSVLAGPLAGQQPEQISTSPTFRSVTSLLTPISTQHISSFSLCTASGISVEVLRVSGGGCLNYVTNYL